MKSNGWKQAHIKHGMVYLLMGLFMAMPAFAQVSEVESSQDVRQISIDASTDEPIVQGITLDIGDNSSIDENMRILNDWSVVEEMDVDRGQDPSELEDREITIDASITEESAGEQNVTLEAPRIANPPISLLPDNEILLLRRQSETVVLDPIRDVTDMGNGEYVMSFYSEPRLVYENEKGELAVREDGWNFFNEISSSKLTGNGAVPGYGYDLAASDNDVVEVGAGEMEFETARQQY
ncbi:MAG: hypothetical protein ABII02_02140 [Candidatus Magasanikbacteria bacterium]